MAGSHPPLGPTPPAVPSVTTVPSPRRPPRPRGSVRGWYENELGWATVPGSPVRLFTGRHFDVLEVPAGAGRAALGRIGPAAPVALRGDRMRFLVRAGGAEELPGLLRWLEWGAVALDLTAIGAGGSITAPLPPGARRGTAQGAAVWLRPPVPGREESSLPTMSAPRGDKGAPDLVRLVDTLATEVHRARLWSACAQPLAFS
ncbi:SCO3374 family protein [Streptomyces sp. NPDC004539]|uniref:SCO3374 family protein n=1 Tax=Streptomyces sp. NPDC004539 TaxID=3154280 RepID=UPI0033AE4A39